MDLILRFIATAVIWEGWRRTAMAPPGLRLLWGRAHGPGAARGVRGAWRGGRPSAVVGAGQPAHQWFRDGVRVAGGGRQPEDRGRIPTHRVEDGRPYRAQGRRPLGILDAVHVRRSHRDRRGRDQLQEGGHTYITVVVDHKRRRVVWAHDGYGKEVPGLFFRQPTDEQRASIKAVTGDGAKWIDASVKERLPNAGRVPDSFHIVSRMSDAPDQVRKRVRNQARRGNDKTATEAMRGVRYAVPKNPEDLTERQDTDPRGQPYRSWQLKELLGTLPHQPTGQAGARLKPMDLPGLPQPPSPRSSNHSLSQHSRNHSTTKIRILPTNRIWSNQATMLSSLCKKRRP